MCDSTKHIGLITQCYYGDLNIGLPESGLNPTNKKVSKISRILTKFVVFRSCWRNFRIVNLILKFCSFFLDLTSCPRTSSVWWARCKSSTTAMPWSHRKNNDVTNPNCRENLLLQICDDTNHNYREKIILYNNVT